MIKKSKPVLLSASASSKKSCLVGKVSELWCFIRCLQIIIFDYISSFNDIYVACNLKPSTTTLSIFPMSFVILKKSPIHYRNAIKCDNDLN